MKKSINRLKKKIEKQAKELNKKYPDPTLESGFDADPLWKKQMGDMGRLENLKTDPERFNEVFAALLPPDMRKALKKRLKDKSYFDLSPLKFPLEGVKSKKVEIEMSVDDLETVLDALSIAQGHRQEVEGWKERWDKVQDRVSNASRLFWNKGLPGFDHKKTLRDVARLMGWTDPKKGKQKRLHPVMELDLKIKYESLIKQGTDKKTAALQLTKEFGFSNEKQCVQALRKLGLKKLPTFHSKD